jgi:hypothetical protein
MHAISSRITSLYWFNLSLKSLLKFPDTWEPIQRIGREIRMLEPFLLEGDAYQFERRLKADGTPDWDLASIVSPSAAVLFANDTAYIADTKESIFKFGPPRAAEFSFRLPHWLRKPAQVFRMDGDGLHEIEWSILNDRVTIKDTRTLDAMYVVAKDDAIRAGILKRRQLAIDHEATNFVDIDSVKALRP